MNNVHGGLTPGKSSLPRRWLLGLRGAMTTLPLGRRFVLAYAILGALFDLSVLLPGNPYTSVEGFVVGVGIQVLILWRLWHGSSLAWLLAMFLAAGMVFSLILMQPDPEAGVILVLVLSVAQVLILWMYALTRSRPLSDPIDTPPEPDEPVLVVETN